MEPSEFIRVVSFSCQLLEPSEPMRKPPISVLTLPSLEMILLPSFVSTVPLLLIRVFPIVNPTFPFVPKVIPIARVPFAC